MRPTFLLMCAKFEGNLISRMRLMAVFLQVSKKKKRRKNESFFGWCDLL